MPFTCTCYRMSNLVFPCSGTTWGYLQHIVEIRCSGATGLHPSYLCQPTNHSLEYSALGLLGLPRSYLCQPAIHQNTSLWDDWGYLGATFANQQTIGIHCSGATGTTSELPSQTSKSLEYNALGQLGHLRATFANQQIIGIQCSGATGATSGLTLPTSKSLE